MPKMSKKAENSGENVVLVHLLDRKVPELSLKNVAWEYRGAKSIAGKGLWGLDEDRCVAHSSPQT